MKSKQAIMVIGHGNNSSVLQKTINVLDDKNIDFFIHCDKKYKKPFLKSVYSKIHFINSLKVNWGTDTLMKVEINLLRTVYEQKNYKMAHLISSSDIPLMDKNYFINYFNGTNSYLGFSREKSDEIIERVKYYWPSFNLRNKRILSRGILTLNKFFHINRLSF